MFSTTIYPNNTHNMLFVDVLNIGRRDDMRYDEFNFIPSQTEKLSSARTVVCTFFYKHNTSNDASRFHFTDRIILTQHFAKRMFYAPFSRYYLRHWHSLHEFISFFITSIYSFVLYLFSLWYIFLFRIILMCTWTPYDRLFKNGAAWRAIKLILLLWRSE